MQLKKCVLTSLLFAPMWLGADILPKQVESKVSIAVLRVEAPAKLDEIKTQLELSILFLSVLVGILILGQNKIIKEVYLIIKVYAFKLIKIVLPKNKKNHYYHFYAVLDIARCL